MAQLHEELIFYQILPRLPAKFLLKFKRVCRQWNSLISSPEVATAHVNHPSHGPPTSVLTITDRSNKKFHVLDYGGSNTLACHQFGIGFDHPFFWLCASCNGLAFLIATPKDSEEGPDYDHLGDLLYYDFKFVVCNPVLADHGFLEIRPPLRFRFSRHRKWCFTAYSFGFGYVSSEDDYYIVAITLPRRQASPWIVVYVYSFKSRRWGTPRIFESPWTPLAFQEPWWFRIGTLVEETVYWVLTLGEGLMRIAAFDLADQEKITFMHLPYPDFGEAEIPDDTAFSLCCMRGCLCAWGLYEDGNVIEMWMLKKYGVQELWTYLFRFNPGDHYCRFSIIGLNKYGMGLTLNEDTDEMTLTDFRCRPPRFLRVRFLDQMQAVNYFQSLVSPLAII